MQISVINLAYAHAGSLKISSKDPLRIFIFKDLWQVFEDLQRSLEILLGFSPGKTNKNDHSQRATAKKKYTENLVIIMIAI